MAKQTFPGMPTSGGGMLPKLIGALVMLAVLAFVVQQPVEAAQLVRNVLGLFGGAVDGLATFFSQAAN
ncbi:hypothetical protein [Saccharopolyspora sp. 6M]|uniref:hypothetical protein n=1 Tax=Saccharopolyspora sp. 6M TaxID=2877237 RepID=UPI001CD75A67|nr:hypothetical protein [Saccharopolyspora sp. 6M]MCA1228643.1 hypothetical protein [Saccharopolyspora sp. 6M]